MKTRPISAAVQTGRGYPIYTGERSDLIKLPMDLEETARLRLEHTEASLKELGGYVVPEGGKVRSQSSSAKAKSDRR